VTIDLGRCLLTKSLVELINENVLWISDHGLIDISIVVESESGTTVEWNDDFVCVLKSN